MKVSTLRPGLFVALKTSITGNVTYRRIIIEPERRIVTEDGIRKRARWDTTKLVALPDEHEEAVKVRSKARALITGICAWSGIGLICRADQRDKLEEAIAEANQLVAAFNADASLTRVSFYAVVFEVAPDDVAAMRAINSDIREMLDAMAQGVENLDVKKVRDNAQKLKDLSDMLDQQASERVREAVRVARQAARRIVKAGEAAALEIDAATMRRISDARTLFLDEELPEVSLEEAEQERLDLERSQRRIDMEPERREELERFGVQLPRQIDL